MRIRVQVVIEGENGHAETIEEIGCLERGALRPEELGLTLCEAKQLLHAVEQTVVAEQVEQYLAQRAVCSHCGRLRSRKGTREIVYRTLFGKLKLVSLRLYDCPCQESGRRHSTSPLTELLAARMAPELSYLETKFASLMSYGLSVELLAELLPIGSEITRTTMRRELHRTAERIESELGDEQFQFIEGCQRDWERLPAPAPPLTVGLDGGYVTPKIRSHAPRAGSR